MQMFALLFIELYIYVIDTLMCVYLFLKKKKFKEWFMFL